MEHNVYESLTRKVGFVPLSNVSDVVGKNVGFYSEIVVLGLAVLNKLMWSISELQVL